MKTNSFAFSSAWGLAVMATAALIIGTQYLRVPSAIAASPPPDVVFVPADLHNAQRGVLGYIITTDGNNRTVDVLGTPNVSGTIEFTIDGDEVSIVSTTLDGTIHVSIYGDRYGAVEKDGRTVGHWVSIGGNEYRLVGFDALDSMSEWQILRAVLSDSQFGIRGEYTQIDGGLTFWTLVVAVVAIVVGAGVAIYTHIVNENLTTNLHCALQDQCCWDHNDDPIVPCCDDFFNNCQGTVSHNRFCDWLWGVCAANGYSGGACDDYDNWCM